MYVFTCCVIIDVIWCPSLCASCYLCGCRAEDEITYQRSVAVQTVFGWPVCALPPFASCIAHTNTHTHHLVYNCVMVSRATNIGQTVTTTVR